MDSAIKTRFTARPYAGDSDLQAICDLLNLCDEIDQLDEDYMTIDELRLRLNDPNLDKTRDMRLWEDQEGRLVGFGQTWIPKQGEDHTVTGRLILRVHPDARNMGLEDEIIAWGSERARGVAQERGLPAVLHTGLHLSSPEYVAYRKPLLEKHGFKPVRYFFKMARPLNEPIPEPKFPEGFTVRHAQGETDMKPWVEMFNQSFVDHWNFHPMSVESHKNWLSSANYRPERNLIALAPDGTFAAFCFCWIDPTDNAHRNRNEGWIDVLGTRRGFRKIGLGKAMLLAGMRKLHEDGADAAVLGVDAENPTGALGLYESVGFQKVNSSAVYEK